MIPNAIPLERAPTHRQRYKFLAEKLNKDLRRLRALPQLGEDLVQEAILKGIERSSQLRETGAEVAWHQMICKRLWFDHLRMSRRNHQAITHFRWIHGAGEPSANTAKLHQMLDKAESYLLDRVSEPRKSVATMFYLHQISVQEISERLRMKPNTVLSHLRRFRAGARAHLRSAEDSAKTK